MKPEIAEKIDGYELTWADAKVKISVNRIKQHKDNRITGWVMFTSTAATGVGLIHQCELNFASSQTQKQLVNVLIDKEEKIPWDNIVEQLRYYILERVRQGEPVLELHTEADDINPPGYLIYPVLPLGQPTIIFGDPGVCKTELALVFSICLLLPWYDNPLGLIAPERSTKVLFIDYESEHNIIQWRLKCLQQGMGLPPLFIPYRRSSLPLADDVEQIQRAISETQAEVIIIDSLGQAAGGDLKEPSIAMNFFSALRKLRTTSLIIAQTTKDPDKKKTIFGSSMFTYYSRSVWEVRKTQQIGEDELDIALFHRKANESKLQHPLGFNFFYNENKTLISPKEPKTVPEFLEGMTTETRIYEELRGGAMTPEDLSEELGLSLQNARTTLSRLKKKGKVINIGGGKWGLSLLT